jgi:hypothetical protein
VKGEYYMINKTNLDKRICDVEENCKNTQTYREFIRESEEEFGMCPEPIDQYSNTDLQEYLEELDCLWEK